MPAIELSAETIAVVQKNMRPMIDTIDTAIQGMFRDFRTLGVETQKLITQNRTLIDYVKRLQEENVGLKTDLMKLQSTNDKPSVQAGEVIPFPAPVQPNNLRKKSSAPAAEKDLTGQKIAAVCIDGVDWNAPDGGITWNQLIREMLRGALDAEQHIETFAERAAQIIIKGPEYEKGFRYHPDLGISIRSVSANDAWVIIRELATGLKISVDVLLYDGECLRV